MHETYFFIDFLYVFVLIIILQLSKQDASVTCLLDFTATYFLLGLTFMVLKVLFY